MEQASPRKRSPHSGARRWQWRQLVCDTDRQPETGVPLTGGGRKHHVSHEAWHLGITGCQNQTVMFSCQGWQEIESDSWSVTSVYSEMCTDCGDFCPGSSTLSVLAEGAWASRGVGTAGTQLWVWGDQPSRWWTGLESAGGTRWGPLGRQGLGLLPSALQTHAIAAGRSTAAHEAVCVEVLKTSAGLGLSLDGGKSSMAGDGPLLVKRVYKGNVLEKPVHCPLPVFCLHVSAFHLEIKFVFKSLPCF